MKKLLYLSLSLTAIFVIAIIIAAVLYLQTEKMFWIIILGVAGVIFLFWFTFSLVVQQKIKNRKTRDKEAAFWKMLEKNDIEAQKKRQAKLEAIKKQQEKEKKQLFEQQKSVYNDFLNYIHTSDSTIRNLENDERICKIVKNFFKQNTDCLMFPFLDAILPKEYKNITLIDKYQKLDHSLTFFNEAELTSSSTYLFLNNHAIDITSDGLSNFLTYLYRMANLQNYLQNTYTIDKIQKYYALVDVLLNSLISTGLIQKDFSSKTACLIFFVEQQNKLIAEKFQNEIMVRYNLSFPHNILDLATSLLKVDVSFPIEEIILYGSCLFHPYESRLTVLGSHLVEFYNLSKQIKQENYIRSLEKFDDTTETVLTIDDLNLMSGFEFESFVTDLFTKMGYKAITTKKSGDQGVDVLAEKNGITIAIQTKCYNQPVGNKAVQEIVAGMKYYNAQKGLVATNNNFTPSAKKLAEANGITLWNGETLLYKSQTVHDDFTNN